MTMKLPAIQRVAKSVLLSGLFAGAMSLGTTAQAALSINYSFGDAAGTGFFDPSTGAARRQAMFDAASGFSAMFGQYFSDSGSITLLAKSENNPLSGNLASAGSFLALTTPSSGFNLQEVSRVKVLTGTDLNGSSADGVVNINFGHSWQLGATSAVSGSQFDFYAVMYHEFTHVLGFSSMINRDGTDIFGESTGGNWGNFDQFLVDKSGNRVINPTSFDLNPTAWSHSTGGSSNGLYFDGANAVAANGGAPVALYSPSTFSYGSSVSHLDQATFNGKLMTPFLSTGLATRSYGAVEVGIMADLGYSIAAVPEPESYAMLLAGLSLVGWAARRRRL